MKHFALLLVVPLLIGATGNSRPVQSRFGQTVYVDGPRVTPLALLEDSRCPQRAQCIWAGRVRISARVRRGGGARVHELELGKSIHLADGSLTLVSVSPGRKQGGAIVAARYHFGFTFAGGLEHRTD